MSEATYLYCLLRGPRPSLSGAPSGLPGLSPPRVLEVGDGLWLITAGAPLAEYGADEIQRRLQDLAWVSDRALAHDARTVLAEESKAGGDGSGKSFLLRKKLEQDASRELAGRLRDEMDAAFAELAEGASEAVRREPAASPESGGRLLLDAAFLVPSRQAADFEAIVERIATRLAPRACEVTLTGPWPPYNFIAEAR
jgi:hypothetical protein